MSWCLVTLGGGSESKTIGPICLIRWLLSPVDRAGLCSCSFSCSCETEGGCMSLAAPDSGAPTSPLAAFSSHLALLSLRSCCQGLSTTLSPWASPGPGPRRGRVVERPWQQLLRENKA